MSKEQIKEILSITNTPDVDSSDVEMAFDTPHNETAANKRQAQQDWLNYLKTRDYVDAENNVCDASSEQIKDIDLIDDENNAYYDEIISSSEGGSRADMGIKELALAAREARESGDTTSLGGIEDEIQDRLASMAEKYGWGNEQTMSRLDTLTDIIYGKSNSAPAETSVVAVAAVNETVEAPAATTDVVEAVNESSDRTPAPIEAPAVVDEITEAPKTIADAVKAINDPSVDPEIRKGPKDALSQMQATLDAPIPLQNESDDLEGVEPLENESIPEDVEPLENESDDIEPLQNEDVEPAAEKSTGIGRIVDGLRSARDVLWTRPGQWLGAKLVSLKAMNRKENETDEQFKERQEKRGKVIVGIGYAAVAGAAIWGTYKLVNGLSGGGGSGHIDVDSATKGFGDFRVEAGEHGSGIDVLPGDGDGGGSADGLVDPGGSEAHNPFSVESMVEQFSEKARTVERGEGGWQTLGEMGVSSADYEKIWEAAGSRLSETGQGDLVYRMGDGRWGWNDSGVLDQKTLDTIAEVIIENR